MRRVKRFYSKTFSVPLPDVDDLDEETVLTAFYEETFERMSDEDREQFMYEELLCTPEEKAQRERVFEEALAADEEFMRKLNKDVKAGKTRGPPPERAKLKLPEGPVDPKEKAKAIKARIAKGITSALEPTAPEPLPDIHMKFEPEGGNLPGIPTEWLDMDPSGPNPPKK